MAHDPPRRRGAHPAALRRPPAPGCARAAAPRGPRAAHHRPAATAHLLLEAERSGGDASDTGAGSGGTRSSRLSAPASPADAVDSPEAIGVSRRILRPMPPSPVRRPARRPVRGQNRHAASAPRERLRMIQRAHPLVHDRARWSLGLFAVACGSGPRHDPAEARPPAVTDDGGRTPPQPRERPHPHRRTGPGRATSRSPSRRRTPRAVALAWVNGEVVTYRDVLREVGPQLQVRCRTPAQDRVQLEDPALRPASSASGSSTRPRARPACRAARQTEIEEEVSSIIRAQRRSVATGGTLRRRSCAERDMDPPRVRASRLRPRHRPRRSFMRYALGDRPGHRPQRDRPPDGRTPTCRRQEVKNFWQRPQPGEVHASRATARFRMLMARPDSKATVPGPRAPGRSVACRVRDHAQRARQPARTGCRVYREFHVPEDAERSTTSTGVVDIDHEGRVASTPRGSSSSSRSSSPRRAPSRR